ncbi:MAG: 4Fe-4S binding protein, partial [Eubacteriales bacterium]|nr:4Fe-4S binding protein [Eubacteriales bacterium]
MQYGYEIVKDMINGMSHFMDERGVDQIEEFVGMALPKLVPAEDLNRDFKVIPKIDEKKCVGCGRCYVSCYDGAHQAIDWDDKKRRPSINDDCVGCHLCVNVCPVKDCITPGEIKWKEGRKQVEIKIKQNYD